MKDPAHPSSVFSALYFGKDDAESDSAPGGLLRDGFIHTSAYRAAQSGRKSLIIGRKGSGKSAISVALLQQQLAGIKTALITPDEISADEIRRFKLVGIPDEQSKALLWRYIFAVQLAKFIVQHSKSHGRSASNKMKKLRKFLQDNGETDDFELHEKFWRVIERLKTSISLEAFGAKLAVSVQGPVEGISTSNSLDFLEKQISEAVSVLACPSGHDRIVLIVDQLEKIWSNDPDSDKTAIGLLLAAKHVAANFRPNASCILLLRTDIYEVLQFQDRDKFRGDEMRIDWDAVSLKKLALTRARVSTGSELNEDALWAELFPRMIHGQSSDEYLLKHTLMRPRDLIQLCNLCRDTAEKNGRERIMVDDVDEALTQYSNWKLQDLNSEYRINYPFLGDLFILFQNTSYYTSKKNLQERLSAYGNGLRSRYPEYKSTFVADGILRILYAIGFLGVMRNGVARYSYNDKPLQLSDLRFVIHPAFREALRSTRSLNVDTDEVVTPPAMFHEYPAMDHEAVPVIRGDAEYRLVSEMDKTIDRIADEAMQADLPYDIRQELRELLRGLKKNLPDGSALDADQLLSYSAEVGQLYRKVSQNLIAMGESSDGRLIRMLDESARVSSPSNIRDRIYPQP